MQSFKMLVSNIKNSYRIKTKFGISIQKHFVPDIRYTLKALSLKGQRRYFDQGVQR